MGTYQYKSSGDTYKGMFEQGKKSGNGEYMYSNGDVYVGEFRDGMKHGRGRLKWSNGQIYEGDWSNDQMDGYGIVSDVSGNTQKKRFVKNIPQN